MPNKLFHKRATSTIEYAVLLIILLATFLAFQKYMVRGFVGRWKEMGDAFGYGKQYDPKKTIECGYSAQGDFWYGRECSKNCQDSQNLDNCINNYCGPAECPAICAKICQDVPPSHHAICLNGCNSTCPSSAGMRSYCNTRCKEFGRNCCMCQCDTEPAPFCEASDVCNGSDQCGPYSCGDCNVF